MAGEILHQRLAIGLAAFAVAQRVDLKRRVFCNTKRFENVLAAGNDFDVAFFRQTVAE